MRKFRILIPLLLVLGASAEDTKRPWPLWDHSESVESYAGRCGLLPSRTLRLPDGAEMHLMLIPPGKYVMGTPQPVRPDLDPLRTELTQAMAILGGGILVLTVVIGQLLVRVFRSRRRLQLSLRRLIGLVLGSAVCVMGGVFWKRTVDAKNRLVLEHKIALARFQESGPEERPSHEVIIGAPFYLGKYEVTQAQYQAAMGSNPSRFRGPTRPVECVSWDDAQQFCRVLSELSGEHVALPSEAQWEYACRAGSLSEYCAGDGADVLECVGWTSVGSTRSTRPVGGKDANAFGLHDMHGNVEEWVEDDFHDSYVEAPSDGKAWVEEPRDRYTGLRVARGGSWDHPPDAARSAGRNRDFPDVKGAIRGFRVATHCGGCDTQPVSPKAK